MWTEVYELAELLKSGESKWEDLDLDDVDVRLKVSFFLVFFLPFSSSSSSHSLLTLFFFSLSSHSLLLLTLFSLSSHSLLLLLLLFLLLLPQNNKNNSGSASSTAGSAPRASS